ncbi:MAG: hypothetical protein ACUVWP_03340 [bacterium]
MERKEEKLSPFILFLSAIVPLLALILVITFLRRGKSGKDPRFRILLLLAAVEPIILLFIILFVFKYLGYI